MTKLIVDVECGARECGGCHIDQYYADCEAFNQVRQEVEDGRPLVDRHFRLPACLAAEADLTRLVEAARDAWRFMRAINDGDEYYAPRLEAALAPFEEARHE